MAGIDLPVYRSMRDRNEEWLLSKTAHSSLIDYAVDENRKYDRSISGRIIAKAGIDSVVHNHIKSDCFIETEKVEISLEEGKKYTLHGNIPEGAKYCFILYVDLQEFGAWAKSAGYTLPPEFPIGTTTVRKKKIPSAQRKKLVEVINGLMALDKANAEIQHADLYGQLRELILERYTVEPTVTELLVDLQTTGVEIARQTLSQYLKTAFGE